jgi:HAD superfamily hydrolase (TIGR01509 family)
MIKAIIFDCFGVVIGDGLSALYAEHLVSKSDVEKIRQLIDRSNKGLATADESSRQIATIFGMTYEVYRAKLTESEVKDEALLQYIQQLRSSFKTAMLSNIPAGSLMRRFSEEELAEHFDVIVASGEIGYAKPEAQAYEITADRLGVRLDECVFTDDRQPYVDGAQGVGMHAILYQDFPQFRADLETLLADTQ